MQRWPWPTEVANPRTSPPDEPSCAGPWAKHGQAGRRESSFVCERGVMSQMTLARAAFPSARFHCRHFSCYRHKWSSSVWQQQACSRDGHSSRNLQTDLHLQKRPRKHEPVMSPRRSPTRPSSAICMGHGEDETPLSPCQSPVAESGVTCPPLSPSQAVKMPVRKSWRRFGAEPEPQQCARTPISGLQMLSGVGGRGPTRASRVGFVAVGNMTMATQ
jgi:hypothetical protein